LYFFLLYLNFFQFALHRTDRVVFLLFLFAICMFYIFSFEFIQFAFHKNNLLICFLSGPLDLDHVVFTNRVIDGFRSLNSVFFAESSDFLVLAHSDDTRP
jgi:hypothetical protein